MLVPKVNHQDYYIFSRESQDKPLVSFSRVFNKEPRFAVVNAEVWPGRMTSKKRDLAEK